MKDRIQTVLAVYSVLVSLLCIFLLQDNEVKEQRIEEEVELKYEYSMVIDSLEEELEGMRHWHEMSKGEIESKYK